MTNTSYRVYKAGIEPVIFQPGDFILVSTQGVMAKIIRLGQLIRYHGQMRPFAHWNHAAMIVDTEGTIVEAVGRGVVTSKISEYINAEYYYVSTQLNAQSRSQAVAACNSFLKDKYAFLTIISIALELLTGIKMQFTNSNTMICSAIVAQSLWAGGVVFDRNPYQMMPADLAATFNINCTKK